MHAQAVPANLRDGRPEGEPEMPAIEPAERAAPPPAGPKALPLRELKPELAFEMLRAKGSVWKCLDVRTPGAPSSVQYYAAVHWCSDGNRATNRRAYALSSIILRALQRELRRAAGEACACFGVLCSILPLQAAICCLLTPFWRTTHHTDNPLTCCAAERFSAGHMPGSVNAPVKLPAGDGHLADVPEFQEQALFELGDPEKASVLVVSDDGQRSAAAIGLLSRHYAGLVNVAEGLDGWLARGLPVEK